MNQNYFLNAFPAEDYARIIPNLQLITLQTGKVIYDIGNEVNYVYFPINCIISMMYLTEEGALSEVAAVGNEGLLGISLFMGSASAPNQIVVRSAGQAYRIHKRFIQTEFDRHGVLLQLLLRYTQALITQMAQTAVCNRHHLIEQQLCRWLLFSLDRITGNEVIVTHELISNMLGVRREGVTEAAGRLQHAGIIQYNRGHMTVTDRQELEKRSCECYQVVKNEYDRLLPEALALNKLLIRNQHDTGERHRRSGDRGLNKTVVVYPTTWLKSTA